MYIDLFTQCLRKANLVLFGTQATIIVATTRPLQTDRRFFAAQYVYDVSKTTFEDPNVAVVAGSCASRRGALQP